MVQTKISPKTVNCRGLAWNAEEEEELRSAVIIHSAFMSILFSQVNLITLEGSTTFILAKQT